MAALSGLWRAEHWVALKAATTAVQKAERSAHYWAASLEHLLVACLVSRKVVNLEPRKVAWRETLMVGSWDSRTVAQLDEPTAALWGCRKAVVWAGT